MAQPVQGPDGNLYQFPDGTTKETAIAYFKKKGIGAASSAPSIPNPIPPKGQLPPGAPPGFAERFGQFFGLTSDPLSQLASEGQQFKTNPVKSTVDTVLSPLTAARDIANKVSPVSFDASGNPSFNNPLAGLRDLAGGQQFSEDINTKNYTGALGTLGAGALSVLMAKASPSAVPTVEGQALKQFSGIKPGAVETITQGVNPEPKNSRFEPNLQANFDSIKKTAQENGMTVSNREGLLQATQLTAEKFKKPVLDALEKVGDKSIDVKTEVPGFNGWTSGGERPYTTVRSLYERLNTINDTLEPKYAKEGRAGDAAVGAEEAMRLQGEAARIRSVLYQELQKVAPEGIDIADYNARAGQLNQVADSVEHSLRKERYSNSQTIEQKPPESMTELLSRMYGKAYSAVAGNPLDKKVASGFNNGVPDRPQYIGSLANALKQRRR